MLMKESHGMSERIPADDETTIWLTDEPVDPTEVLRAAATPQSGATLLFLGTVREITAGRQTLALDYEAYPEMALRLMQELAQETRRSWPVKRLALVHRLGHLQPGEISIAIAVSTAHRAEAFDAGRFLIDQFKQRIPIWKKENWGDGTSEWVHPGLA
jgi:molybdopterin synthase catalytic subunit